MSQWEYDLQFAKDSPIYENELSDEDLDNLICLEADNSYKSKLED